MKKTPILFLISFLLIETVTAQQWNGSSDQNGTIYRNGNITANGLHFGRYGASIVGDSNPYNISSADGAEHDLMLFGSGGLATLNLRLYDGDLKFGYSTTPTTILYNNGSASFGGNVGIDATNPTNKLQIGLNTPGWGGNDLVISNSNGALAIHNNVTQTYLYGTGNIAIRPGYGRMSIYASSTGKVGIGHDSPQKSLDVNTGVNDFASIGYTLAIGEWSGLHFGYKENNILYRKSAIVFERVDNDANGKIHLLNNGTGSESATLADSRLTIDQNGNVGINTTSPNEKLTVNGAIYGKEVRVDLSVPGPDYVFNQNYPLKTLEEVQSFIDQNKHLPEVPSAKEMQANGINVGEMNMLLLKKIEELTLYVIELQNENKKQDELIEQLQNKK